MAKSARAKPNKPFPTFPLTAHPNGQWCKKIHGTLRFFGVWSDPEAALARYHEAAPDLHAGRSVARTVARAELTVKELANRFLAYQADRVNAGQLGPRSFEDNRRALRHFTRHFRADRSVACLSADEFLKYRTQLVRYGLTGRTGLGVHALTRTLTIVRSLFAWAVATGLIQHTPSWGDALDKPSAAETRRSRAQRDREHGKNLLTADEIRKLLALADPLLKPAILLGINGGFGNTDCAALPQAAVDLNAACLNFERPKTAVARVVPLWKETVAALRALLEEERTVPVDSKAARLLFRTESGRPLVRQLVRSNADGSIKKVTYVDRLGDQFDKLLRSAGVKRRGLGFYSLRHTFRTWADETRDQHAIHRIMGHAIPGMSGIYVEEISLERLRAVTEYVRGKLFD